jgi:hypothetical protein
MSWTCRPVMSFGSTVRFVGAGYATCAVPVVNRSSPPADCAAEQTATATTNARTKRRPFRCPTAQTLADAEKRTAAPRQNGRIQIPLSENPICVFRLFTISLTLNRVTRENQVGSTSTSAQAESSHFIEAIDCDLDHREERRFRMCSWH